jgi:hypothetical protein
LSLRNRVQNLERAARPIILQAEWMRVFGTSNPSDEQVLRLLDEGAPPDAPILARMVNYVRGLSNDELLSLLARGGSRSG